MILFVILGVVVLMTFIVLGVLFFMLAKEGQKKEEEKSVVPVTDLTQLKKELSTQLFEQNESKVIEKDNEIIPVFEAKTSLPVAEDLDPAKAQPSQEDVAYKKRAQQLEDELLAISKKADGQSDEARQMIETLTKENESLKSQQVELEQAKQKLTEIHIEAEGLKTENLSLQSQLESTNAKVHLLEEEMAAVKVQMGEEITRANQTVAELSKEKEEFVPAPAPEPDPALGQELEALRLENVQLKQKYDELERIHLMAPKPETDDDLRGKCEELEKAQQELNQKNVLLTEQNDQLQYELVKARAQTSGLERVSFNYKNQLEDFFKKVNAVQVTNDHLSQVKNRLEGMIEEVKTQNDDLIKKEHLAQFEIEKNRSRLQELEREYDELKSRLQQQSQQ